MDRRLIVSLIPSYDPTNEYVREVVAELKKSTYVILFTTQQHDLPVDHTIYFDKSIGRDLVYQPRKWIVDNIHKDWQYALYNEDDILIPDASLLNVIKLYETLPSPFIPGFIRYEHDHRDNTKRYFDMNPLHAAHRHAYGTVKEKWPDHQIWEPWNLHTGTWLFSKVDIETMIEHDVFETKFKEKGFQYGNCDQLESAASVPYLFYTKVFPYDIEHVEVKHLPKKYIYLSDNPTLQDITSQL